MRKLRQTLDVGLGMLGVVIILSAILWLRESYAQMAVVMTGILIIEVGVWKLATQLLPNERRFHALRYEVNVFIELCRQLNEAALLLKKSDVPEHQRVFADIRERLHDAVDRMADVAGQPDKAPVPTGRSCPTHRK